MFFVVSFVNHNQLLLQPLPCAVIAHQILQACIFGVKSVRDNSDFTLVSHWCSCRFGVYAILTLHHKA